MYIAVINHVRGTEEFVMFQGFTPGEIFFYSRFDRAFDSDKLPKTEETTWNDYKVHQYLDSLTVEDVVELLKAGFQTDDVKIVKDDTLLEKQFDYYVEEWLNNRSMSDFLNDWNSLENKSA